MRLLKAIPIVLCLLMLAACGGAKPTAMALPSATGLPAVATSAPIGTGTVAAITQRATAADAPVVLLAVSPTPLTTAAGTPAAAATAVPAKAAPVATGSVSARPTQPVTISPAASTKGTRVADIPTSAPQQALGVMSDGLTLLNVRSGKDDGFTRLVFDLSKPDGSAAPVPRTRLWVQDGTIIVAFGGVRDDMYASALGGGENRVNIGMVQSVYRIPIRDDASAAYGIVVGGATRVTLSSATQPTRVIVDVADK